MNIESEREDRESSSEQGDPSRKRVPIERHRFGTPRSLAVDLAILSVRDGRSGYGSQLWDVQRQQLPQNRFN